MLCALKHRVGWKVIILRLKCSWKKKSKRLVSFEDKENEEVDRPNAQEQE